MTDPTPLSPAAQAVLDAYHAAPIVGMWPGSADALGVAAALRVAADQVVPEEKSMPVNLAHRVWWDSRQSVRFQLLAIAAELEGAQ